MNKEMKMPKFTKIQALLVEHEDTYEDLAKIIDSGITTVQYKLSGKRKWNWTDMIKIKNHYKLSDEKFMSIFFNF